MNKPTPYHSSGKDKDKKPKEEKTVERVTSGEVVVKKPSLAQKFKSIFFTGSFKQSVGYVVAEVLVPAARNTMADAGKNIIDRAVFGDKAPHRPRTGFGSTSRVQYSSPFRSTLHASRPGSLPDQAPRPFRYGSREANDIILASREEAQLVLERLGDLVDQYECASLADLYDLVGLPSAHTDNKWGWTYLNNATIRSIREGFLLDLPPMEPLD